MPCITFIVPIYNMERLLPRALRSLRAQTLTDFEAILINDGSKDGSAALCAQAAAEDARFRFIDQPNGGVAAARNAGLDAARGEYIFFWTRTTGWSRTPQRCCTIPSGTRMQTVWSLGCFMTSAMKTESCCTLKSTTIPFPACTGASPSRSISTRWRPRIWLQTKCTAERFWNSTICAFLPISWVRMECSS